MNNSFTYLLRARGAGSNYTVPGFLTFYLFATICVPSSRHVRQMWDWWGTVGAVWSPRRPSWQRLPHCAGGEGDTWWTIYPWNIIVQGCLSEPNFNRDVRTVVFDFNLIQIRGVTFFQLPKCGLKSCIWADVSCHQRSFFFLPLMFLKNAF